MLWPMVPGSSPSWRGWGVWHGGRCKGCSRHTCNEEEERGEHRRSACFLLVIHAGTQPMGGVSHAEGRERVVNVAPW